MVFTMSWQFLNLGGAIARYFNRRLTDDSFYHRHVSLWIDICSSPHKITAPEAT